MSRDGPDSATEQQYIVDEGDIIVAASDGLFDNLYDDQVAELVNRRTCGDAEEHTPDEEDERRRAPTLSPAELLGSHALRVARSCTANSPFAEAM